ncbi:GntR family transcriptional regulator [Massilia sp. H-1]|nr:GntR family transcriptional regulator [Massilia sp. H-1]
MTTHTPQIFSIATGSSEPIYRQLVEQARRLIAGGQLAPGDAMPSVREIAQALALNPMTVSKAYGLLELEGALTPPPRPRHDRGRRPQGGPQRGQPHRTAAPQPGAGGARSEPARTRSRYRSRPVQDHFESQAMSAPVIAVSSIDKYYGAQRAGRTRLGRRARPGHRPARP